jgi:UDP-N-acetylglucosamine 2-epimerase (non-hydrolysing)
MESVHASPTRAKQGAVAVAEISFVVGARPNFVKVAPVYQALKECAPQHDLRLIHTGQHYDHEVSDVFVADLSLPKPDAFLAVGSGTHAEQTARALVEVEKLLIDSRPALVVVAGDVNSTLAAALAAAKLHIPVAHIEAGLRSFDLSMPEEHNRKLADHLSAVLLTHSPSAVVNLGREGIAHDRVHLVGNTMIDSLFDHLDAARARRTWEKLGLEDGAYGLVTLHRPELVDAEDRLRPTVRELVALAETLPLVFPVHPRTRKRLETFGLDERLHRGGVVVVEPLGYLDFLGLESAARFVLTDSGGVQEETSALGVRCFTLRDSTERPITIELGTNTLLGVSPERIADIPAALEEAKPRRPIPLWDGRAGQRAAEALVEFLEVADGLAPRPKTTEPSPAGA